MTNEFTDIHRPVLEEEILQYLQPTDGRVYTDGTLGLGGHTEAILKGSAPSGKVIGFEWDREAFKLAEKRLAPYGSRVTLVNSSYSDLVKELNRLNITQTHGLVLDLGVSSLQLDKKDRGFSFRGNDPLDMRMNTEATQTAADIINHAPEQTLKRIFKSYGEERWAGQIAKNISAERSRKAIRSSKRLAEIVSNAIPKRAARQQRIHPATRVFMALRIAVNKELERLETFMDTVINHLNPRGRLCIISYHSLEDRIVKHRIKALAAGCQCPGDFPQCVCGRKRRIINLTRKPVLPSAQEIKDNPMARSARLRAAEKL